MQNELFPVEIEYTDRFKKDLKRLYKRYRSIQKDVNQFIQLLQNHQRPGDQLQEVGQYVVHKARVKNSDNNKGQSGGYRICYLIIDPNEIKQVNTVVLILIYSKSDQDDIRADQVASVIAEYLASLETEE